MLLPLLTYQELWLHCQFFANDVLCFMVDVNMVSLIYSWRYHSLCWTSVYYLHNFYKKSGIQRLSCNLRLDPIQAKPTLCHGKSKLNTIAYTLCATATFKLKIFINSAPNILHNFFIFVTFRSLQYHSNLLCTMYKIISKIKNWIS